MDRKSRIKFLAQKCVAENAKAPPHGEAFAERMLCLNEQRREHKRDRGQQLDQDVQARAGRVFERITQGIADDRGLVSIGTLAAVLPALDELLGVIPSAAAVIEESRHQEIGRAPCRERVKISGVAVSLKKKEG